jgi:hypothetical protein
MCFFRHFYLCRYSVMYKYTWLHAQEKFEVTKGQLEAVNQRTNNDIQNTTQKTKDRATLKSGVNSYVPEGSTVPAPLATPVVLLLNDKFIYELVFLNRKDVIKTYTVYSTSNQLRDRRDRHRLVVGSMTTYAISAYHD